MKIRNIEISLNPTGYWHVSIDAEHGGRFQGIDKNPRIAIYNALTLLTNFAAGTVYTREDYNIALELMK